MPRPLNENSKITELPGRNALDIRMGAIHYKDNYADGGEPWKDIDTTIVDGRVTKAPYELTIDMKDKGIHVRDKKTGVETTMRLAKVGLSPARSVKPIVVGNQVIWQDLFEDTDAVIEVQNTRVKFKRILKSNKAPLDAEFEISKTGHSDIVCRARDADNMPIEVSSQEIVGKLTETLDIAGKKFPITIDPTWEGQVDAAGNDSGVDWDGFVWTWSSWWTWMGYRRNNQFKRGGDVRFSNVPIPVRATVIAAYLTLTAKWAMPEVVVNARLTGEVGDRGIFMDLVTYQAIRGTIVGGATDNYITSAQVDWNNIGAWLMGTEYNSPSIVPIVQEIVNGPTWVGGSNMRIFCDDHDDRSDHVDDHFRDWNAYEDDPATATKIHIEYSVPHGHRGVHVRPHL